MNARVEAENAALKAVRAAEGLSDNERLAYAVAAAIEAYEQARERPVEVAARLLRPKPGDVIVFHVAEPLTQQEMWDYEQTLNRALDGFEGVRAIVAECVTDITVVRDETKKEARGDDQS